MVSGLCGMNEHRSRQSFHGQRTPHTGVQYLLYHTMKVQILVLCAILHLAAPFPMKLLKVPKIYNALITTNQRLLPSEAVPASTGPVFQPLGLTGDPILLNPEAFVKQQSTADQPSVTGEKSEKSEKMPAPVVFYPRYNVYHQLPQSVFPYHNVFQPPPIVVPVERSQSPLAPEAPEASSSNEPLPEEVEEPSAPESTPARPAFGFVPNNSPKNTDIPNVPPPPPPVGAPRPLGEVEEED